MAKMGLDLLESSMRKYFIMQVVFTLVLAIAAVSCQPRYPPIEDLLVDATVFPDGWYEDIEGPGPDSSAPWGGIRSVERTTLFFHSPTAGAEENIERYARFSIAKDEFTNRLNIIFRDHFELGTYSIPDELPYTSSVAEQYRFGCVTAPNYPFPFYGCQYLAQYGLYIVHFHIGWNLDVVSAGELEDILRAIDDKMAPYMK